MKKFSEVADNIEELKKSIEILPTGFKEIDHFLEGGFLKKELVIIGAPTGKGKSLVAGQIFHNIAKNGHKSAYFSLEISNEMIASRLIGAQANLSPTRIMIKMLEEEEAKKRDKARAEISPFENFMAFYDDLYKFPMIVKEIKDNEYEFVVIDFIQNVITGHKDEYERLSGVALGLQQLAKEKNCCILVVSQLSNMMARDKKSSAVEYKGSGSIGMVADLGFFIEEGIAGDNSLSIKLRKNRRGTSGVSFNFAVKQPGGRLVDM